MTTGPSVGVAPSSATQPATAKLGSLWSGRRFFIAALLFLNLFINFMHRINLSIAAPAIAKDFNWDAGKMGLLFSSYQWTYCLFLLLWGWMSDRVGTRLVNGLSVAIWSVAGMLTGVATSFASMLATRLALGAGEAASFPTSGKVVRQWFPPEERGLATAIFNAGTFAGPAFSAPLVAWLLLREGWRVSFMITGSLGFVWVALWLKFFRTPSECSWLPEEEREYLLARTDSQSKPAPPKGTLFRLMGRKTMWGLFLTQGCCAYTMLLFLFWLPSYLVQARHMSLVKAGWFTSVPYVVAVVLGLLIGKLSDSVLTREAIKQGKRRTLLIVFILLSCTVLLTNMVANEFLLLLLISISLACISSALSLNIALTNDLVWNPEMVGIAMGFLILGGNIFGSLVPIATGYIVKWPGSFDLAFYLAG
ncbi:MAG: transporter, family, glucarate transporter, partial [Candidatus Sulfotelmatobacter sp.]|nr:transporter, family, glucarate transporter [Candidatus Sulfotelmatobacter sp.]